MNINKNLKTSIAVLLLLGGAVAANLAPWQGVQTAPPQVPVSGPAWLDSQDIGNGLVLDTVLDLTEVVTLPATGESVRALVLNLEIVYGVGLIQQIHHLDLHAIADATPIQYDFVGIDRNAVVALRDPLPPISYRVTISPKPGQTWGDVAGVADVDIAAVEL